MDFTIRPFTDHDYEALAELLTACEDPVSADALRRDAANREPQYRHGCWLAEADGRLIGAVEYLQKAGMYHPRKFESNLVVLPAYRRQGVGAALFDQLLTGLRPFDPISLGAGVRENDVDACAFANRRGFVEVLRVWVSVLDLSTFRPEAYSGVVDAVQAQGYELRSHAELMTTPDFERRFYNLFAEVRMDVPSTVPRTEIPFEVFMKRHQAPEFYPEAQFIALKDGEMVGFSGIRRSQDPNVLHTAMTAVRRPHRGAGVAKALKLCSLAAVKAAGHQSVKTWNASQNHGMLAINHWLGFVRQPAWINMKLQLLPEEEGSR